MNEHLSAIDTYGLHRVKNPNIGQMVSAYKMGYSIECRQQCTRQNRPAGRRSGI